MELLWSTVVFLHIICAATSSSDPRSGVGHEQMSFVDLGDESSRQSESFAVKVSPSFCCGQRVLANLCTCDGGEVGSKSAT